MGIKIADLFVKIGADTQAVEQGLEKTSSMLTNSGAGMAKTGALMTATVTTPLVLLGKTMLNTGFAAEQAQVAFSTMLGSGEKAKVFLDDLRDFAAKTPFEFTELEDASKRMLAFGFAASDVLPMMTAIGDASSGLGIGAEGVNRVTLALGQMKAKAKASSQEMMQLTEAGIPAWKYLAASVGLTTGETMKLVEQGLIPADTAIDAIVEGVEKDFGGMMADQMSTAEGQASNLNDMLTTLSTTMVNSVMPEIKEIILGATDLVGQFNELPESGKKTIMTLVGLAVAAGPAVTFMGGLATTAGKIIGIFPGLITGINAFFSGLSLTTALGAAGLTPMAITLGAIALTAGAVAAVLVTWNKQITETNKKGKEQVDNAWKKFFDEQVKSGKSAIEIMDEYKNKQNEINNILQNAGILKLFIKDQEQLKSDTDGLNQALALSATSYQEYYSATAHANEPLILLNEAQWNLVNSGQAMITGVANGKLQLEYLTGNAEAAQSKLGELVKQYNSLQTSMQTWLTTTAGKVQTALGQSLPEASLKYKEALGAADEILGTSLAKETAQTEAVQALVDQYARTGDLIAFKEGLQAIKNEGLSEMKTQLADTTTQAQALYDKLLALPRELKIKINFDDSKMPSWLRNQPDLISNASIRTITQARALGGPVWAGQTYRVNERGTELFTPGVSGYITPISQMNDQRKSVVINFPNAHGEIDEGRLLNLLNMLGHSYGF